MARPNTSCDDGSYAVRYLLLRVSRLPQLIHLDQVYHNGPRGPLVRGRPPLVRRDHHATTHLRDLRALSKSALTLRQ